MRIETLVAIADALLLCWQCVNGSQGLAYLQQAAGVPANLAKVAPSSIRVPGAPPLLVQALIIGGFRIWGSKKALHAHQFMLWEASTDTDGLLESWAFP